MSDSQFKSPYLFNDRNQNLSNEVTALQLPSVHLDPQEVPAMKAKRGRIPTMGTPSRPVTTFPVYVNAFVCLAAITLEAFLVVLLYILIRFLVL